MTHVELVERAERWLRNTRKCSVVLTELCTGMEVPDIERFYMTPAGLLSPGELPEHWGLLEVEGRTVRVARQAAREDRRAVAGMRQEIGLLVSALRRVEGLLLPASVNRCIREMNATEVPHAR